MKKLPPIVRLTVVGGESVGKTRLIDSYVNAPPEIPEWNVPKTTRLELYHKVIELPADALSQVSNEPTTVLVELEDTPASTLLSLRDALQQGLPGSVSYTASIEDEQRLKHPMTAFLDVNRSDPLDVSDELRDYTPFGIFKYPRDVRGDQIITKPITQGRMGLLIVFSMTDPASLNEAIEIYSLVKLIQDRFASPRQLLCFLLGNKDDLIRAGSNSVGNKTKVDAEGFSARSGVPFFNVSASSGRDIERVFNEMVALLVQTPALSLFELRETAQGGSDRQDSSRSD